MARFDKPGFNQGSGLGIADSNRNKINPAAAKTPILVINEVFFKEKTPALACLEELTGDGIKFVFASAADRDCQFIGNTDYNFTGLTNTALANAKFLRTA